MEEQEILECEQICLDQTVFLEVKNRIIEFIK